MRPKTSIQGNTVVVVIPFLSVHLVFVVPKMKDVVSTGCTTYIRELVDSLCRDGADAQYMHYLSKSDITQSQICYTYLTT